MKRKVAGVLDDALADGLLAGEAARGAQFPVVLLAIGLALLKREERKEERGFPRP
jgi:hypothetical protein